LEPRPGDGGYKWRDNRCEGVFDRNVSGTLDMRLVSFASGLQQLSPNNSQTWKLTWTAPEGLPVEIHAISFRDRHYYRMDTPAPAQGSFDWPTSILRSERLAGSEVGVVALASGKVFKDAFVPLRIQGSSATPELLLAPGTELESVKYAFDALAADGSLRAAANPLKNLGLSFYPPGRAFRVPIPPGLKEGYYRLSVRGPAKTSGTIIEEFVIYWPKAQ
jgi:hypothetical protein